MRGLVIVFLNLFVGYAVIVLLAASLAGLTHRTLFPAMHARFGGAGIPFTEAPALSWIAGIVLAFGVLFTLNQFLAMRWAALIGLAVSAALFRYWTFPRRSILVVITAVSVISALIPYFVFDLVGIWMREGINHDLIIYARGGEWAGANGTLASEVAINAHFLEGKNIGDCAVWIGANCPLHRGGTHSLAALSNLLSAEIVPAQLFMILFPLSLLLLSTLSLHTGATTNGRAVSPHAGLFVLGILICACAPLLGTLWNTNLATAAAITVLLSAAALFTSPQANTHPVLTAATMGAMTGVCAHIYSESMWVCGALTAAHVTLAACDLRDRGRVKSFAYMSITALAAWIIVGNVAVFLSIESMFFLSDRAGSGQSWPNYFLSAENWRWIATPYSGHLHNWDNKYPALIGVGIAGIAGLLCLWSANRLRYVILIALAVVAVLVIELTGYEYGVHKVIQVFGPVVVAAGLLAGLDCLAHSGAKTERIAVSLLCSALLVGQLHSTLNFSDRNSEAIEHFSDKIIPFDSEAMIDIVGPGDTVLINDASWGNGERFSKTNWMHFLMQKNDARARMGFVGRDPTRGAYLKEAIVGTLSESERIDFVIQSAVKAPGKHIIRYEGIAPNATRRTALIDLREKMLPAVYQATGWHGREARHQWTRGAFRLDVFGQAPADAQASDYVIELKLGYYAAPEGATVSMFKDGENLGTRPAIDDTITLEVTPGYQYFEVRPSWQVQSPADVGASGDQRKLFAMVQDIFVRQKRARSNPQ